MGMLAMLAMLAVYENHCDLRKVPHAENMAKEPYQGGIFTTGRHVKDRQTPQTPPPNAHAGSMLTGWMSNFGIVRRLVEVEA